MKLNVNMQEKITRKASEKTHSHYLKEQMSSPGSFVMDGG